MFVGRYFLLFTVVARLVSCTVQSAVERLEEAFPGQVQTKNIPPPYNERFDEAHGYRPAAMVNVSSSDDVIGVLEICHDEDTPVAVRSNEGSSYIGQSTINGGIVMDLEKLTDFDVVEEDGRYIASLGAGLRLLEVYSRLARHDPPLGLAGGSGPTVGVAGLISGGGHGLSSAKYGVTADRLVSADVVVYNDSTEKFQLVTATAYNEYSDLLFALRGGMGGNYGVIVTLRYRTFPVTNVVVISGKNADINPSLQARRIKSFQTFMHSSAAGPEMFGIGKFLGGGAIQYSAQCICDESGDCTSCQQKVQALADTVGIEKYSIIQQSFGKAMWFWADCTAAAWMDFYPPDGLQHCTESELESSMNECWDWSKNNANPYKAKSLYFPDEVDLGTLEAMAELSLDPICRWNTECVLQFDFYGHAMSEEPQDCDPSQGKCTAFDHRISGWHLQMIASWYSGEAVSEARIEWLHKAYDTVLPVSLNQAYQNYIDSDLSNNYEWIQQYFPSASTYPRLQQVKCKYNSIDMFSFSPIEDMTIQIDDKICGRTLPTSAVTTTVSTTTPFSHTTSTATTTSTTSTKQLSSTTATTTASHTSATTSRSSTTTLSSSTAASSTSTAASSTSTAASSTSSVDTSTTGASGDCSVADAKCAAYYPGSYCKTDQNPPVCWGSNEPCHCGGTSKTTSLTTSEPFTTSSTVSPTTSSSTVQPNCRKADSECAASLPGSYCMYWKSPSLCWGSNKACQC
ncbi:hypothetical protein FOZ61_004116 [Perkinsus olseni]|uniref:FAD-binding PCMH-type domain-containing protein n=1 Tax=Perkinsus olseni TaxID=32597 RepID=A0A7J6M0A2_PEROL|nr:hypothetical protein FOZ61_004116 [Perkinsus olseni]KAF4664972.1 hypothetical protein FOL46_003942 [Perkinsus olseni]